MTIRVYFKETVPTKDRTNLHAFFRRLDEVIPRGTERIRIAKYNGGVPIDTNNLYIVRYFAEGNHELLADSFLFLRVTDSGIQTEHLTAPKKRTAP